MIHVAMFTQAVRQAELERQWKEREKRRLEKLAGLLAAKEELEKRKTEQAQQLGTMRAQLERLKAEKHGMVMQLKQVNAFHLPTCIYLSYSSSVQHAGHAKLLHEAGVTSIVSLAADFAHRGV
jgi:predicted RNase H-like nuclease (RuvC/YqgF family)